MAKEKMVALLPMKAHSERVSGKNFRPLGDKPLFRWILDTLLSVEEVTKVVINTDAREVLASKGLVDSDRVMIRDRKPEICGDLVSMNRVLADDVDHVDADVYLMTHTTNPFLSAKTVRAALRAFSEGAKQTSNADSRTDSRAESGVELSLRSNAGVDSVFTVNRMQTRFYRADGSAVNHDPKNLVRTQDLEPWFEENSCLYVFTKESFRRANARIGTRPAMVETPRVESIDIDTPEDWALAEFIVRGGYRPEA